VAGIRQTRATDLREFYEDYDDKFSEGERISREFSAIIDILGDALTGGLAPGFFTRRPVFFSLFIALYDARFGLPKSTRKKIVFRASTLDELRQRLARTQARLAQDEPPAPYVKFREDSRYATADVGRRRARHDFLWRRVLDGLRS
jgi:hypothetical protein